MQKPIAIQGYEGCFHQVAVQHFFEESTAVFPCATFRDVVQRVSSGEVHAGVMAIENSIAGSILPNYALLQQGDVQIVGEVYIPIRQHLLVYPGVQCSEIREVHSHPMALLQCQEFIVARGWRMVETADTALSARHLREQRWKHIAVVAGSLAAELFRVEIAVADIHTVSDNYTRFLVLQRMAQRDANVQTGANKASLLLRIAHTCGSLAQVLSVIALHDANVSHLQSLPVPDAVWHYSFHLDIEFSTQEQWHALLDNLARATSAFHVYGVYRSGREPRERVA